jgi:hypothetical protein
MTYGRLSRTAKHTKRAGLPPRKISSFLNPVMDHLGLRTLGVYSNGIPCKCSQVFTRVTGRSIETRVKEHHQHIRLGHAEKSAVVEHTKFQHTQILSTTSSYMAY